MKIFVNVITTIRFAYTLILPILVRRISNVAFIINILALFLTDSIDGILARKFKVQTIYGSVMDTVADKTLCIMLLIALITENIMFTFVLLGELVIAIIIVIVNAQGIKTQASKYGKSKMWAISITIIAGYMANFKMIGNNIIYVLTSITVAMQIVTIVNYIITSKEQKENSKDTNFIKDIKSFKDLKYVLFNTDYYLNSLNENI